MPRKIVSTKTRNKLVRKAIIPAAGYGTRFLPVTKASPKEMLPIVDKPVIQYVVEEAVSAGIEEIIFITSSNKRALEDHFDYNFELEHKLKDTGKNDQLNQIRSICDMAKFVYVRQKEAKGNGHAVLMARELVDDEPFLVLWGDEFLSVDPPRSVQLIEAYEQKEAPIITVIKTDDPRDTEKYGFIDYIDEDGLKLVKRLIEKPGVGKAPSNLGSIGGYVLTSDIFPIIESLPEHRGEIWLPEAINEYAKKKPVYAKELINATYYDSGSKFGFIKANIDLALQHSETKDELLAYLKQLRDA